MFGSSRSSAGANETGGSDVQPPRTTGRRSAAADRPCARRRRGPRLGSYRRRAGPRRGRHPRRHHRRHLDRRRRRRLLMSPASSTDLEHFARGLTRRRVFGLLDLNFAGSGLISGNAAVQAARSAAAGDADRGPAARASSASPPNSAPATRSGCRAARWSRRCAPPMPSPASSSRSASTAAGWSTAPWSIPIPVSAARALGADIVIAVNLQRDVFGRGTVVQDHSAETDRRAGDRRGDARRRQRRRRRARSSAVS